MNLFKNIQIPDAFSRFRLQSCCLFTDCKFAIAHGQQMSKWAIKLLENFIFLWRFFAALELLAITSFCQICTIPLQKKNQSVC